MSLLTFFDHPGFTIKDGHFIEAECQETLIHGTAHAGHLVPSFIQALKNTPEYTQLEKLTGITVPEEAFESDEHDFWSTADAVELVFKLIDILDSYAPINYYFGTIEGDSSDYGIWKLRVPEQ